MKTLRKHEGMRQARRVPKLVRERERVLRVVGGLFETSEQQADDGSLRVPAHPGIVAREGEGVVAVHLGVIECDTATTVLPGGGGVASIEQGGPDSVVTLEDLPGVRARLAEPQQLVREWTCASMIRPTLMVHPKAPGRWKQHVALVLLPAQRQGALVSFPHLLGAPTSRCHQGRPKRDLKR